VNIITVGASVKSARSVKSIGVSVETYRESVGTDGAADGAAVEPVGVTVKHCNKLKRYEPGLQSGSWDYEGNNVIVI
jgi:hypothetical protein